MADAVTDAEMEALKTRFMAAWAADNFCELAVLHEEAVRLGASSALLQEWRWQFDRADMGLER